jgi:response regulator RpfG family c-di-GMP phosphodiesterase
MNGVQTIQSINKLIEKNKRKKEPVIFITGYADENIERDAKALKPVAYIYKPFEVSYLLNKIKGALR